MPEPSLPDKTLAVAKLLSEQSPLCAACLSAKSGLCVGEVMETVKRFDRTMSVKRDIAGRCSACQSWTLVFAFG